MYAESHEDFLLFQWRGETLEMLETAFTRNKLGTVRPPSFPPPPFLPPFSSSLVTFINSPTFLPALPPSLPPSLLQALLDTLRRYNSLPLFLAGITQELFERSTMH